MMTEEKRRELVGAVEQIIENNEVAKIEISNAARRGEINEVKPIFFNIKWLGMDALDFLFDEPEEMLKIIGDVLRNYVERVSMREDVMIDVRLVGFDVAKDYDKKMSWQKSIQEFNSALVGKLIVIEGDIKAKTDIIPEIKSIKWGCRNCSHEVVMIRRSDNPTMKKPSFCPGCRGKNFSKMGQDIENKIYLTVEESHTDATGTEMKRAKILLRGSLANPVFDRKLNRGARVKIIGIMKAIMKMTKNDINVDCQVMFEANNIDVLQDEYKEIRITEEDREEIKKIIEGQDPVKFLANEIFSSIHGHNEIKQALICQLVGAENTKKGAKSTRGNIHILLLGDPGIGKSTLIDISRQVALKSRYASGKSSSGVGITANVIKDESIGSWIVEAGAFPLAHNGILCLDELDKISNEDKSSLHEALEKGTVTINKANVHATLRAETSLLAAANPEKGRFNTNKEIYEQFNLLPTLVNRFDLIFVFIDEPSDKMDEQISDKIIRNFMEEKEGEEPKISIDLFKKYLILAKEIKPAIEEGAISTAKQMYMNIRRKSKEQKGSGIPISPRALESSIRLSKAHARARLSNKVEQVDVKWAIDIMTFALGKISVDLTTGIIDVDIIETGVGKRTRTLSDAIEDFVRSHEKNECDEQSLYDAFTDQVNEKEIDKVLERFRKMGDIISPKPGKLKWNE